MDDLTRYLELADRLQTRIFQTTVCVGNLEKWTTATLPDEDCTKAASAIRSLVERVRELEEALEPWTHEVLSSDRFFNRTRLIDLDRRDQNIIRARAAYASQKAAIAPKALPPIGEAGS